MMYETHSLCYLLNTKEDVVFRAENDFYSHNRLETNSL